MSVVIVETDYKANPGVPAAAALAANLVRAYLEIQNKDAGPITFKLGPNFIPSISAVQKIAFSAPPTGGTFTITFAGQTTSALAFGATAAQIQTALAALSTIGANNIVVAGDYVQGFTLTFQGNLANMAQPLATVDSTALTNSAVATTAVQLIKFNLPPTAGTFELTFGNQTTPAQNFDVSAATLLAALNALSTINGGVASVAQDAISKDFSITFGGALANAPQPLLQVVASSLTSTANQATQQIFLSAAVQPKAGTFTLSNGTDKTAPLAFDISAADLQAALQAMPSIGAGNVTVAGINLVGGFTITYAGTLITTAVPALIAIPSVTGGMQETDLMGDTLESDDVAAGLDERDPGEVILGFRLVSRGHGVDNVVTTVSTTVPGGVAGPVTNNVTTTVAGSTAGQDGINLNSQQSKVFDTEVPVGALWISSQNNNALVTVLEG